MPDAASPTRNPITAPPRVLAIVQAGGQGSRMDVLTRERAKPALPWGGTHQLIDFTLSNLANSDISDVWVSVQFLASSLDEHLQGGRPWDLDRNHGGYRRVVPEQGRSAASGGFASGNAHNLFQLRDQIAHHAPDLVVTSSADHVFAADLRPAIAAHLELGAECTILTSEVPVSEARHKAVVSTTGRAERLVGGTVVAHRVSGIDDKPARPRSRVVATEIFIHTRDVLLEVLGELHSGLAGRAGNGGDAVGDGGDAGETEDAGGLGDFAEHLLPALISRGRTHAVPLPGYWKDVGRPSAYLQSHRDLVRGRAPVLDDASWPILTNAPRPRPALIREGAVVTDSLIASGCDVRGDVVRSVLGPGVRVGAGARIVDSVIFADTEVEAGARIESAVIDTDVRIGRDATVGLLVAGRLADSGVTLVGRDSRIAAGTRIERGARLEPGTRA